MKRDERREDLKRGSELHEPDKTRKCEGAMTERQGRRRSHPGLGGQQRSLDAVKNVDYRE